MREPARTNFSHSALVHSLASLSIAKAAESSDAVVERLGQWLGVSEAIAMFAALDSGKVKAAACPVDGEGIAALQGELHQVRSTLAAAIRGESAKAGRRMPQAEAGKAAADFTPHLRYYQTHQRDMAMAIGALRLKARAAAANAPAVALRQLAQLDTVWEQALAERERELFAHVPGLLEKHFRAHVEALAETPAEIPTDTAAAENWLPRFREKIVEVLLAELDTRLSLVTGLVEALGAQQRDGHQGTKSHD